MEDLIAAYPEEFFSRKQFVLVGRQKSFAGVGRFDLLFEDEFKSTILIELKARTLKYEDATQVAKYRDELKRNGCRNIVMWLVAPQIPHSVREFLDDKGIEYTEIHLSEFRRVADRHRFTIKSEAEPETRIPSLPQFSGREFQPTCSRHKLDRSLS
jgi:RecB family endonuclease NucS